MPNLSTFSEFVAGLSSPETKPSSLEALSRRLKAQLLPSVNYQPQAKTDYLEQRIKRSLDSGISETTVEEFIDQLYKIAKDNTPK